MYGIRRVLIYGDSLRRAVDETNCASGHVSCEHEPALLAWLQELQSARRRNAATLRNGRRLLTWQEEELTAQWVVNRVEAQQPVDRSVVIEHVRATEEQRRDLEQRHLTAWYRGSNKRLPGLTTRTREQNLTLAEMVLQHRAQLNDASSYTSS